MSIDIKDSDVLLVFSYIAEISGDKNLKFRTTAGQFLRVFLGLKKKNLMKLFYIILRGHLLDW